MIVFGRLYRNIRILCTAFNYSPRAPLSSNRPPLRPFQTYFPHERFMEGYAFRFY